MKKITLLAMSFIMALTVKAQYGTDVTSLLTNPDFESGTDGWTTTGGVKIAATAANYGYNGTSFMEEWVPSNENLGNREWSQTIEVPNGVYSVRVLAHAIKQSDGSVVPSGVVIYANSDEVPVTTTNTNPPTEYVVATVVTDGKLTIGYRITSCNINWTAWDNIRLTQYLSESEDEAKTWFAKDEMNLLKESLELVIENPMSAALREAIEESFAAIETVETFADAEALWNTMKAQAAEAEACVAAYEKLIVKIDEVLEMADSHDDTDALYDAVGEAEDAYNEELLSAAEALAMIETLNQAVYDYQMSIADGSIAFDVTEKYVTNAALRDNNKGWSGNNPAFGHGVAEFYNTDFDIYQQITGIPNGKYVVKVQGFYREAGNDGGTAYNAGSEDLTAKLYANSDEVSLMSLYKYTAAEMGVTENVHGNGQIDGLLSSNLAFSTMNSLSGVNYYDENSLTVIVMDGNLKFGLRNAGHKGGSWCAFRDFKLFYYGNFPSVNLQGKMNVARDYLDANEANIPAAVWFMVDEYLYNLEGEGYTEEGAYSDEEINAVILAFDAMWAEALAAVDLFASLKAQAQRIENELIPLGYPGADALWELLEEAEAYFDQESEEPINTYEALQALQAQFDTAIVDYYLSQEATEDVAADFTYFVPNPNFELKGDWTWSVVGGGTDQWNGGCRPSADGGANRQGVNLWGWGITSVDVHQTLTGLPNGLYKVSAEMITQTNYATDQHVYATGAATVTSDYLTVTGWDTYEWTTLTTNDFAVVVDGTLTIGAAASQGGTNSEGWFQATNFKLYYHGPASNKHLQGAWESLKAEAEEAVDVLLPSEEKEVVASLAEATSVADAGNYAEACGLLSATLEVWDSTIVASKTFYGGYYAKLDTIRLYDAYDGCEMVYSFADATIALADAILASDTTTCKVFPTLNEQLHAYANYASTLRDAEREMESGSYAEAYVNYLKDEIIAAQLAKLNASLVTVEKCDELRADLQKAIDILKGTVNFGKEIEEGDVTYLIVNPTIATVEGEDLAGWTIVKNKATNCGTNKGEHYEGVATNSYLDAWNGTAGTMNSTFYQQIGGIPDGTYKLTVAARTDGNGVCVFAATASDIADASTQWADVKNYGAWRGEIWEADSLQWEADGKPSADDVDLAELYPYFMARPTDNTLYGEGYGWSWHTIENIEVTNHVITIGITADGTLSGKSFTGTWMGADDWSLELVKKSDVQSEYNPFLGVENIEVAAPAVQGIFDLFGRRIDAITAPGLYIVNGKKVLVK